MKPWDVWGRKPRPCKVCEARRARPAETKERGVA